MSVALRSDYGIVFSVMQPLNPAGLDRPIGGADSDDFRPGDIVEGPSLLPEDNNALVDSETFQRLLPGTECACAVLVAEGFDYPSVGWIMGISDYQVRHLLMEAHKKLLEAPTGKHLSSLRVWNTADNTMHYVESLDGLAPKKRLRLMPWTGFYDVTRERVYLWDIVQAAGSIALVTRWRNGLGSAGSPSHSPPRPIGWATPGSLAIAISNES